VDHELNALCTLHYKPQCFVLLQDYEDSLALILRKHKEVQPASVPQHVSHTFSRRRAIALAQQFPSAKAKHIAKTTMLKWIQIGIHPTLN
jgi:hypothetical protein